MNEEDFEKAIKELNELWRRYKHCHISSKDRLYLKYSNKLIGICSKIHIELEYIALYVQK